MAKILDAPVRLKNQDLRSIKREGATGVIRYINNTNSTNLPTKRIIPSELRKIGEQGLEAALVFQQRGGAGGRNNPRGFISDFDPDKARRDGNRGLSYARDELKVPRGACIYYAVDHDFFRNSELRRIRRYFEIVNTIMAGRYVVGGYGNGTVLKMLLDAGLIEFAWISLARRHSGSVAFRRNGHFHLDQRREFSGRSGNRFGDLRKPCDINNTNPAKNHAYGAFTPDLAALGGTPVDDRGPGRYVVVARNGLRLRGGPGTDFGIITTVPEGTHVDVIAFDGPNGEWARVDLEEDGQVDGHMFASFLRSLDTAPEADSVESIGAFGASNVAHVNSDFDNDDDHDDGISDDDEHSEGDEIDDLASAGECVDDDEQDTDSDDR